MPARKTSLSCYKQIVEEGLLSQRRMEVYQWLYRNGPATGAEVIVGTAGRGGKVLSQNRARIKELVDRGVVEDLGTRKCKVTGREAILWITTNNLPEKVKSKTNSPTKAEFKIALKDFRRAYYTMKANKDNFKPETIAVCKWIKRKCK